MTFKDRKERAMWELNGCSKAGGEPRKTLKISTPGNSCDDFQIEVSEEFIGRMDEIRGYLAKVTSRGSLPRTKLAAAIVEAAWQGLQTQRHIKKFKFDYRLIRDYDDIKTPLQKLAELSEHLEANGVRFPSARNGPSLMTATLRVLIDCAYDATFDPNKIGSREIVEFDYTV